MLACRNSANSGLLLMKCSLKERDQPSFFKDSHSFHTLPEKVLMARLLCLYNETINTRRGEKSGEGGVGIEYMRSQSK